jgi:5-methylcytosine-specific restriction protein A
MPFAPRRPCRAPGCPALVEAGIGYCEAHGGHSRLSVRTVSLGTTKERGYDANWKRFREWFIRRHPMCEATNGPGTPCNRYAVEVHHIVKIKHDPSLRLVEGNCQSLCKPHHQALAGKGGRA